MNKKGFATSTIVFALLSVFLISISILLVTITNTNRTKNALNEKVVSNIEYGNSSINDIEQRLEELENTTNNLLDKIYPVGSVYISTTDDTIEKVQNRFGGTWEKYSEGRTIIGDGTTTDESGNALVYNANQTGGNTTQILKTDNLPSHNHSIPSLNVSSWSGSHYHSNEQQYLRFYGNGDVVNIGSDGSLNGWDIAPATLNNAGSGRLLLAPWNTNSTSIVVSGQTTTASNTGTIGSNKSFSVQDPYIVTYIYKRVK